MLAPNHTDNTCKEKAALLLPNILYQRGNFWYSVIPMSPSLLVHNFFVVVKVCMKQWMSSNIRSCLSIMMLFNKNRIFQTLFLRNLGAVWASGCCVTDFILFLIYVSWYGIHISNDMYLFHTFVYFCVFIVSIWVSVIVSNDEIKIFNRWKVFVACSTDERRKIIP